MDVAAAVDKITSSARRLQEQLKVENDRMIAEELNPFLADLCKEFKLPGVYLIGYTPYFADGDICVHSQDLADKDFTLPEGFAEMTDEDAIEEAIDEMDAYGFNESCFESMQDKQIAFLATDALGGYRDNPIRDALDDSLSALSGAFEQAYGTNWFLLWKYDEATHTVTLTRGDYEPSY